MFRDGSSLLGTCQRHIVSLWRCWGSAAGWGRQWSLALAVLLGLSAPTMARASDGAGVRGTVGADPSARPTIGVAARSDECTRPRPAGRFRRSLRLRRHARLPHATATPTSHASSMS
jgi:hypothetical protein